MADQKTIACIVSLCLLAGAVPALHAEAAKEDALEEVVVTGTRLQSLGAETPNPTVSISSDSLELAGVTNLTQFLSNQPALVSSTDTNQTTNSFIGSTGLNLLNLRNLGTDRTLVLVDGRRHVAQLPETASVDIDTIPVDLIERIDIATGGVSAVYGADAVSGVVNFIMKKNFTGLKARAQYGQGDGGKPVNWSSSITGGTNFADGRGNIAGSFEFTQEGKLQPGDRSYLSGTNYQILARNPANPTGSDPTLPWRIPTNDVRYLGSSRAGGIDTNFDGYADFNADGTPFDSGTPVYPGTLYTVGGDSTPLAGYSGDLLPKNTHSVASAFLHYDLNDHARLFGEGKFAHGKAFAVGQPTFDFPGMYNYYPTYIAPDNAFISPGLLAAEPAVGVDGAFVIRDNFDLGARGEDITRSTLRTVIGVNGDLSNTTKYEVSYTYGKTTVDNLQTNNRYNDRFAAAVDAIIDPATGQPTCRSNLDPAALPFDPATDFPDGLSFTPGPNSGCVPLNIMGEGVSSQAARAWVMTNSLATSKLTQQVFSGFLSGQAGDLALQGGPVGYVLGGEWRRETSESHPAIEDQLGQTFNNKLFPTKGSFDVKEGFFEVRVPVLKGKRFADTLQFTGAARLSSYTTVGTTKTWNLGANWAPIHALTFRGTLAQSVRAPNIGELFAPQSQDFNFITDPCDVANLSSGTQYRAANCATILNALSIDPTTYTDPNITNISGLSGGNPNLAVETAKSWTMGLVFRPEFAPDLQVTLDSYDIIITNAINTADAQTLADNCVDQPTINNVFCASLTRGANGGINHFVVQPQNVANFHTAGVDFNLNYALKPANADLGKFAFTLAGGHLNRLTFIKSPGADVENDKTTTYAPEWQGTLDVTWYKGPVTVNYAFSYFSKTARTDLNTLAAHPNYYGAYNYYASRHTHDLQVAWDIHSNLRVYVGVNNLANQKPDLSSSYPVSAIGRFLYAGAKVSVDGH